MHWIKSILGILFFFFLIENGLVAQFQSKPISAKDSLLKANIRKPIIRSAILPGWGQITNKKAWKVPLVYGAIGTSAYFFFRNVRQFKEAKTAYALAVDGDTSNDNQIIQPYYSVKNQPERIRVFRNQVRQNVDYSVLFFFFSGGLNFMDAALVPHLSSLNVSAI